MRQGMGCWCGCWVGYERDHSDKLIFAIYIYDTMYSIAARSQSFYPVKRALICFFLCTVVSLLSCDAPTVKRYGFLTMLGQDTISIESITHQDNTLTSDEVDRFPSVRIRHTVVNLNDDGSIRQLVMDIHTPSEPSRQRDRKV